MRAGTLTMRRRRVAPRATARVLSARVAAAWSRLWVIAAQMAQAWLAANRPEGRGQGPDEGALSRPAAAGQERVVTQFIEPGLVADSAHDQSHHWVLGGGNAVKEVSATCGGDQRAGVLHR